MLVRAVLVAVATALTLTGVASAHVTLNPADWEAGGFARFAVRVPTERPDASTTEVTLQFPENVISASFQDVEGWERTVEMAPLDEPIPGEEGEEPTTERLASVTWSGGEVEPGEFVEFPISFQVPEDAAGGTILFPALQTYSSGEIVRWIAEDEEADTPAPRVEVLAAAEEGGGGTTTEEEPAEGDGGEAASASGGGDDDDGRTTLALILAIAGLAAGLVALGIALMRKPGDRPTDTDRPADAV
jgi:uncharacterized protein YcnI